MLLIFGSNTPSQKLSNLLIIRVFKFLKNQSSNPATPANKKRVWAFALNSFFVVLRVRDLNLRGSRFDYQRKADGSMPGGIADERPCNSSIAQSNPATPATVCKGLKFRFKHLFFLIIKPSSNIVSSKRCFFDYIRTIFYNNIAKSISYKN